MKPEPPYETYKYSETGLIIPFITDLSNAMYAETASIKASRSRET
jgi:hypothetical protein